MQKSASMHGMGCGENAVQKTPGEVLEQSQRIGLQFLIADLTIALTFLDIAEVTRSEKVRRRNREHARVAFDTVRRLSSRVVPTGPEWAELEAKFNQLTRRLLALGFVLESESKAHSGK